MQDYMKKKLGVRIQNPEVRIHVIIQSEAFQLLAPGYFFILDCVQKDMRVYMQPLFL